MKRSSLADQPGEMRDPPPACVLESDPIRERRIVLGRTP